MRILGFVDVAFRLIATIIGGMIAIGVLIVAIEMWSDGNRKIAYSDCQTRRMENHIAEDVGNIHLDYCMSAKGYYRSSSCSLDLIVLPTCFTATWRNWSL